MTQKAKTLPQVRLAQNISELNHHPLNLWSALSKSDWLGFPVAASNFNTHEKIGKRCVLISYFTSRQNWSTSGQWYNGFMNMDNLKIGIDGFNYGPFPKPEDLGSRLSQWVFLSEVEAMGFTQENLVAVLADLLKHIGGGLEQAIGNVRQLFVSQFRDAATKIAQLVPEDETVQETTANGTVSRNYKKSKEERVAEVVALFGALFAYLSCVEREGPDRANAYSFLVHETLPMELPPYVLRLPELMVALGQKSPGSFSRQLKQWPSCAMVTLGIFEEGRSKKAIERPEECSKCSFLASATAEERGWIKECSECASRPRLPWGWNKAIIAGRIPKLGEGDVPDLHDPGCYLEALLVSLLVGREDFVAKSINLSLAQEESLQVMDGKYAELGGEQGIAESLAQGYLDKQSQGITKASFANGEAFRRAEAALNVLEPMMTRFKEESTKELKETERLDKLIKPLSLDTEVEDEQGRTTPLSECIRAEQDLLEAVWRYDEAVSELPKDMQPIFRRVWEEGEAPKQAAINLGYDWTSALERQVERMIREIYAKLTD